MAADTGIDMNQVVGRHDLVFLTLDTLRYDVAVEALAAGQTPHLAALLPGRAWLRRHAPASFTYAAHQAMFAGFLPTPAEPRVAAAHQRLFALDFPRSRTTGPRTCVLEGANIVHGLAARGYHTVCIGGVGFFNKRTPLGRVLPELFADSHWDESMGVTDPESTAHQVALAARILGSVPRHTRVFLFIDISAMHQPNYFYLPGAESDSKASQRAALAYVDRHLGTLFQAMGARGGGFCIACSDHGTAYGEDGFQGHRIGHPVVWDVPYAHFFVPPAG